MQLRTYTGLWRVEKRLYKFYDVALPYPVSIKQVGVFLVAFVPWIVLMTLLRVPFGNSVGFLLYLAPPFAVAWYSNRPIAEGKTLWDFVFSQLRFLLGHKAYASLTPTDPKPRTYEIVGNWWRADSSRAKPQ